MLILLMRVRMLILLMCVRMLILLMRVRMLILLMRRCIFPRIAIPSVIVVMCCVCGAVCGLHQAPVAVAGMGYLLMIHRLQLALLPANSRATSRMFCEPQCSLVDGREWDGRHMPNA
jgi:hypothetical protein